MTYYSCNKILKYFNIFIYLILCHKIAIIQTDSSLDSKRNPMPIDNKDDNGAG